MTMIFSTFEAMHAYVQERKGNSTPSFMANIRGIKIEVFVSSDKGLWFWATQGIIDRLSLQGSPGQRCLKPVAEARKFISDNGLSSGNWGVQKQTLLESMEWFIPFVDWLSVRAIQRDVETNAFNESISAGVDEHAPWFTVNIQNLRHRFSFLKTGALWCFVNERVAARLGLSITYGKHTIPCGQSRSWIELYAIPGAEKQTALDYADHLKQQREIEFAEEALETMKTMQIINANEEKEVIVDTAPTHWKLQENT